MKLEYGVDLPESEFSGGTHAGQANTILEGLGFKIVPKQKSAVGLPLELFGRYGRKEVFAAVDVQYNPFVGGVKVFLVQCYENEIAPILTLRRKPYVEMLLLAGQKGKLHSDPPYIINCGPSTRDRRFVEAGRNLR